MNEQEYQRRILQSQERTIERLGEVQKGLDQLEVTVSDLRTENARLRAALAFYRDGIKTLIEHIEPHWNETIHIAPDDGTADAGRAALGEAGE